MSLCLKDDTGDNDKKQLDAPVDQEVEEKANLIKVVSWMREVETSCPPHLALVQGNELV